MKVITFASIKDETEKTSTCILVGILIAPRKKVCVIDMDLINSCSFMYLNEQDETGRQNIAVALQSTDLSEPTKQTVIPNVDIIESFLYLVDLISMPIKRLSHNIQTLQKHDYVVIDTTPTYDNIALSAMDAADSILTPVMLTQFDFNIAQFLSNKLQSETSYFEKWFLLVNGYNKHFEEYENFSQKDYRNLFSIQLSNFLPTEKYSRLRESITNLVKVVTNENIIIEGTFGLYVLFVTIIIKRKYFQKRMKYYDRSYY